MMKRNKTVRQLTAGLLIATLIICTFPRPIQVHAAGGQSGDSSADAGKMYNQLIKNLDPEKPVAVTDSAGNLQADDKDFVIQTLEDYGITDEASQNTALTGADYGLGHAAFWMEGHFSYYLGCAEKAIENANLSYNNTLNTIVEVEQSGAITVQESARLQETLYKNTMQADQARYLGKLGIHIGRFGARVLLYGASAFLNGYAAVQGAKDLSYMYYVPEKGFRQETTGGRIAEGLSLGVATGFATYGCMAATAAIFGFTWPVSVPLAVGSALLAAFFHSETGNKVVTVLWEETKFLGELAWHGTKWLGNRMKDNAVVIYEESTETFIDLSDRWDRYRQEKLEKLSNALDYLYHKTGFLVRQPFGTGAYKPNIYIYANTPTPVTVTFADPYLLRTVDPVYDGSWQVVAEGDGTLTQEDGSTLGYLFYESETQAHYFQTKTGYLIDSDERSARYEEILSSYGFNETEIADFTDFWVDKLPEGVDYMMYPQGTETVDMAMPIVVSPEPEHMTRIWFAFEAYDGQEYTEPVPEEITHDGYSVIEWGGVILDEYKYPQ